GLRQSHHEVRERIPVVDAGGTIAVIEGGDVTIRFIRQVTRGINALAVTCGAEIAQQEGAIGGTTTLLHRLRGGRSAQYHKQSESEVSVFHGSGFARQVNVFDDPRCRSTARSKGLHVPISDR